MKKFLHRDNLAFGVLLSLLISIGLFTLLSLAGYLFPETFSHRFLRRQVLVLVSIFINLLPFRAYMVSLRYEKTGKGILVSIFVLMVLYFVFIHEGQD